MSVRREILARKYENRPALEQERKARREGRVLLDKGITEEQHISLANRNRWPEGSVWLWAREEVWSPMGAAKEKNNGPAMSMDKERNIDRPPSVPRHDSQGDVEGDMYEPQYAHERYSDHQVEGWR